jgi:hypothetical protein
MKGSPMISSGAEARRLEAQSSSTLAAMLSNRVKMSLTVDKPCVGLLSMSRDSERAVSVDNGAIEVINGDDNADITNCIRELVDFERRL